MEQAKATLDLMQYMLSDSVQQTTATVHYAPLPKKAIEQSLQNLKAVTYLLEKGVPVLMTNFSRILNTLTVMHFEDRNQFINSLNRYSLLIIDDLGIERNSDFALEQVFNVIDCRYRSKKPLIITTNLTLSELNNAADIAHKRIYDRILERCIPVRINNRNIRQDNASANLKEAKKILLSNPDLNQN